MLIILEVQKMATFMKGILIHRGKSTHVWSIELKINMND